MAAGSSWPCENVKRTIHRANLTSRDGGQCVEVIIVTVINSGRKKKNSLKFSLIEQIPILLIPMMVDYGDSPP